ncbi:MAG: N(G),N(G)-dimethylarginine dimethylaminohydrolase [Pyrinomonadaceae bacterium]
MLSRAIVRPPGPTFAKGLTSVQLGVPDLGRALEQHGAYCAALRQCGLTLTWLEPDEQYPDSTFLEDTAVITERGAILTRPGAATRIGEVAGIRELLQQFYSELHSIDAPGTIDGGDVCEADNEFFIGISQRTNEAGARQLAELLKSFRYSSRFVDIRGVKDILHLKSGLGFPGDNHLVAIEALADREEFSHYDLVRVNTGEEYAANCVRVNNWVLVASGYPAFEEMLRGLGYQTIALEMTEFQKMDGGLSCLSLRF